MKACNLVSHERPSRAIEQALIARDIHYHIFAPPFSMIVAKSKTRSILEVCLILKTSKP